MKNSLNRRHLMRAGLSATAITLLPMPVFATSEKMQNAIEAMFGDAAIAQEKVLLSIPPIAENGYSVPLSVEVETPMIESNYIKRIAIFSERNPIALIADFQLTPYSGQAFVSTRIRLGGTQAITAIAETSNGKLYSGQAKALVTLAACVIL